MTVLVNQILKSEFVANVSKLFAGKGIAFALTLGSAPIIARLYDPGDYGVIGLFVAACGVLCNVATLKYETAVVLPRSDVGTGCAVESTVVIQSGERRMMAGHFEVLRQVDGIG